MLERGAGNAGVVDAEASDAATIVRERGDERIVGVDDQRSALVKDADSIAPALGDVLELAVAVELVAKQVAERDDPRPDTAHRLRQSELVYFEQAKLRVRGGEQGGGDARREVGARVVPGQTVAASENPRCHRRRRGLAVRPGNAERLLAAVVRRACRLRRDRASRATSRAVSSHLRVRRRARGGRPPARPWSRGSGAYSCGRAYRVAGHAGCSPPLAISSV